MAKKKASQKQIEQRKKFKKATSKCKGSKDYRGCIKKELGGRKEKKLKVSKSRKLKTYLTDVEEMPETIEARNLNEAVEIARMNLGVMEKRD